MSHDLLLTNIRPMGGEPTDMLIRGGRIAGIGPNLSAPGIPTEDGGGALAIPGLVEAHTHLDKSLLGMGWRPHQAGPLLIDKIETERPLKAEWSIDPARQTDRSRKGRRVRRARTHMERHADDPHSQPPRHLPPPHHPPRAEARGHSTRRGQGHAWVGVRRKRWWRQRQRG